MTTAMSCKPTVARTPVPTLSRELRLVDATALVVGCIIGVGIFRMAASIAGVLHTPGLVLLICVEFR